ncbi:MAG: hypothetical protein KDK39_18615 [Leptospiraceae bacterium]|nr:hypothetical protein [Leptospiraceae bacterium]
MNPYDITKYYARKKFLKIFGGEVKIYDEDQQNMLFFVKQKAFKIREDISIYSDTSKSNELLRIRTKSIFDVAGTYDVSDSASGTQVGALRRKLLASFARDTWLILDKDGNEIGKVQEDSILTALLRRLVLGVLLPQSFTFTVQGEVVGICKQTFNPFVPQYRVDFSMDNAGKLDRRLGIAAVVLLQIIEGKQQ